MQFFKYFVILYQFNESITQKLTIRHTEFLKYNQPMYVTWLYFASVCGETFLSDILRLPFSLFKICDGLNSMVESIQSLAEDQLWKASYNLEQFLRIVPLLDQYMRLVQHYLTLYVASHRATSKLLSVLLRLFTDLTMKVSTIIERTLRIVPLLDQYMRLAQHFLTLYMAIHRISLL